MSRANSLSQATIDAYYNLLEETLKENQKREEKKKQKQQKKPKRSSNKVGESSTSLSGLQREEISSDECAMCLGAYQDDFDENGELVREWLLCTSESCAKWMHQDRLIGDNDVYTCDVCGKFFC